MLKIKFIFIYFVMLLVVSFNLAFAYANNAVPTAASIGLGANEPFYYTKINANDLSNLLQENYKGVNIVDIRSKAKFEEKHLQGTEHIDTDNLPSLLAQNYFDIAKPIVIIGEDSSTNDLFAKLASYYGYETYIFEGDVSTLGNTQKLVSSLEEEKEISQINPQTFVNAARRSIDEITRSLATLSQNLDTYANNVVNMQMIANVIDSITKQIDRLRQNPVTGMLFPTDQSVGDVLLDMFRDDRKIRNRSHAEGVSDALNLMGGNVSRRDQRRMSRNKRFEKRQIVDTANDLKSQGYNEAVIEVLNAAGIRTSRLEERQLERKRPIPQYLQVQRAFNNANEATYNNAVAETLKLQGVDLNRRQVKRMGRNPIYQRRQVVGAANDLKGEGFNEGITDTLNLMGIDLSRRDVRRMNRSERGQINAINSAASSIKSQGYASGYQAGYSAGYNKGIMVGLLNTGVSGFRLNRLERKQSRVKAQNLNLRDDFIQRRIDKITERAGTRKLRRYNRQERRDEFRSYNIIKKGRTAIDLAANIPVLSSAALNLPSLATSSLASLASLIPFGSILSPIVRIGTGVVMTGVKTGIRLASDSGYRTQIQGDMRLARADRVDLRKENRKSRIIGAVPFPRINPLDNVLARAFSETGKERRRQNRLDRTRNEVRRTKLEQRFAKRDQLGDLITSVDNVRDIIDKASIVAGPVGGIAISVIGGLTGTGVGIASNVLTTIGGIASLGYIGIPFAVAGAVGSVLPIPISLATNVASYLYSVALDTVGSDYATRARRDYRKDNRRPNRQAVRQARQESRNQRQAERQFGVTKERPGIVPSLQFGPERNLPSIQNILQAGPKNVRPTVRASRQLGPSRNTVGNLIEIGRTAISPSREERRQRRQERQANRPERQQAREERMLNMINSVRSFFNLEPLTSKEASAIIIEILSYQ
jgi:rhodanese-related sulfurtransferase